MSAASTARRTAAFAVLAGLPRGLHSAPLSRPPDREWMFRVAHTLSGLLAQDDATPLAGITPRQAVDILFAARRTLTPDILRSLRDTWLCASAARYGAPYESWEYDASADRDHDMAACETESSRPPGPWAGDGA